MRTEGTYKEGIGQMREGLQIISVTQFPVPFEIAQKIPCVFFCQSGCVKSHSD